MEQPVVGVFNCIIRSVILYLTAPNQNGSEIYRKIVEIFSEKLFVR